MGSESQRNDIVNWFVQNQSGQVDCLFIPENQCNAFMGVVVGFNNPSVAILDYDQVKTNLRRGGMSPVQTEIFIKKTVEKKDPYGPLLCRRFPDLHPNNFNKA
jgi:hypothetical protein